MEWIRGNEHQLRKEREEGNHETKQYHSLKQGEFRYGIRRITDLKRSERALTMMKVPKMLKTRVRHWVYNQMLVFKINFRFLTRNTLKLIS